MIAFGKPTKLLRSGELLSFNVTSSSTTNIQPKQFVRQQLRFVASVQSASGTQTKSVSIGSSCGPNAASSPDRYGSAALGQPASRAFSLFADRGHRQNPLFAQSASFCCAQSQSIAPSTIVRSMTTAAQPLMADDDHRRSSPPHRVFEQEITGNLHLLSAEPRNVKCDPKTLRLHNPIERPLVILPAWLLAKRKPIHKYAELYLRLGFDVLTIRISPWQLLWPAKGTQLVGKDVVRFLHHNRQFGPLFIHGFSVGAYVWGECLVQIADQPDRYAHIVERIVGQVWDSAADITEIPVGVPKAVFPNNPRLNRALSNYMHYHLRTFHDVATQHYERSSAAFHANIVRAPALMFVSEDDPVGSVPSNDCVRRDWERLGIAVRWQCWQQSEHVCHFMRHRDEYVQTLTEFLDGLGLLEDGPAGDSIRRGVEMGGMPEEMMPSKLRAKL